MAKASASDGSSGALSAYNDERSRVDSSARTERRKAVKELLTPGLDKLKQAVAGSDGIDQKELRSLVESAGAAGDSDRDPAVDVLRKALAGSGLEARRVRRQLLKLTNVTEDEWLSSGLGAGGRAMKVETELALEPKENAS